MPVYLDRKIAALAKITPEEESRPMLNAINIGDGVARACDGHMAITVDLPKIEGSKEGLPLESWHEPVDLAEPVSLPAGPLAKALLALKKPTRAYRDIAQRVAFLATGREGRMQIVSGTQTDSTIAQIEPADGLYPDFSGFIKSAGSQGVAALAWFDAKKIVKLCRAHIETGAEQGDSRDMATLQVELLKDKHGQIGLMRLTSFDEDGRKTESILMPLAIKPREDGSWNKYTVDRSRAY